MTTILVFFWSPTCGHSRRMDSVVDHFMRLHRDRVRLAKVNVDERPDLVERFAVSEAPSLVLLSDRAEVARLEGRCTLPAIKAQLEPHLDLEPSRLPTSLAAAS